MLTPASPPAWYTVDPHPAMFLSVSGPSAHCIAHPCPAAGAEVPSQLQLELGCLHSTAASDLVAVVMARKPTRALMGLIHYKYAAEAGQVTHEHRAKVSGDAPRPRAPRTDSLWLRGSALRTNPPS